MKVTIKADIIPLNEQFKPGEEVSNTHTSQGIDFLEKESDSVKKDFIRQIITQRFTHQQALYFRCKVYQEDTDNLIFEHEGYFEKKTEERVHIKWEWDKKESMAIGVTYYPDGTSGDPRQLPDWQQTLEQHRRERNSKK